MKWKKENNIKSLNDPSIKIDSTSSDHQDSSLSSTHKIYKTKMELNASFKSDEEDEDEDEEE